MHTEIVRKKFGDYTLIIYDYMEYPRGKAAQNLICINNNAEVVWIIEPLFDCQENELDCWVSVDVINNEIIANTFSCFRCKIDIKTGKIIEKIETR